MTISNNQNIKEDTPIKIVVKAENGRTRTYKINIKFKEKTTTTEPVTEPSDSNNYLKSLTLSETNLFFKKDILVYNIELDNGVKSLEVSAIAESDKSKVTIENNKELKENVPIKITVTAENGSTRVYTINIKYKPATPTLSSNNLLKEINIKNYDLKFNSSINDYVLKVDKDTEKLDIEVVAEDEKSSYVITGNNKLKNKSKIVILVTAEDGTENVYTITIKKDTNNILLQLLIIVIIIVIIIFGIKILRKVLPGKKDKNYDYE